MKLHLYRPLWGIAEPLAQFLPRIKALGYSGVEATPIHYTDKEEFRNLLVEHGLGLIAQIHTSGYTVREHLDSFRNQIEASLKFSPVLINSHSGADRFSSEDSIQFFQGAVEIENAVGITITHETHRGRILFNPWITQFVLEKVPEVKLCADFSHWVCVCERLLQTETEFLLKAALHTSYLHARVGYEQGPQVTDPRAPEYAAHLEAHEHWWDFVWEAQHQRGLEISPLAPEFGPSPYLHTIPYTNQPIANLTEICDWQAARQRDRFTKKFWASTLQREEERA